MNKLQTKIMYALITLFAVMSIKGLQAQTESSYGNPDKVMVKAKRPQKSPEQKAALLTDTLTSVVALSADQYKLAYASNLKFVNQKEAIKTNNSGMEDAKEKMKAANKVRKTEIAAILTPAQETKWQSWKQARKGQFMQNHPGAGKMQNQNNSSGISPGATDDIDGM